MDIMKNKEFLSDWQTVLTQIVRDPQLYEVLKYCPLDIMRCWHVEKMVMTPTY